MTRISHNLADRIDLSIPQVHRHNFWHLYLDIAWYGVLSGSGLSFLAIYLVRLGATPFQIGLVNAGPAIMTILFALPAGWWLKKLPLDNAVVWSSILFRVFYLFWIPIPSLFIAETQIGVLLALTLVMTIPGTALAVGFNAYFAEVVPPDWRAHVVGLRNALLALTFTVTSLLCGYLLTALPFPLGYQAVFAVGCLGAVMSSYHLWKIRLQPGVYGTSAPDRAPADMARPGSTRVFGEGMRPKIGVRLIRLRALFSQPTLKISEGSFGRIVLVLFAFHLTQYLPIPLYPIYWVDKLNLSDQYISLGNALFYMLSFLGATQLARVTRQLGSHYRVVVIGSLLLSAYPILTALTQGVSMFLFTAVVGGLFSVLTGGALSNYLVEKVPEENRSMHLAWYTLVLNIAILISSFGGPALAQAIGIGPSLALSGLARGLSALAIWRWGR
jgi:MFS family permease